MDHYSILDHSSPSAADEGVLLGTSAARSETAGISAQIAAANALLTNPENMESRFPGEDSGRALGEMAYADLDAALQLLADRAQYITGASGAAIALRRGQHKDMLCRASAGWNAPQPGALLSMEYGLSGESVRTRQLLRCDDAARDPRVNREVCSELGIVSIVIMPIASDDQVIGVFELFSGKPQAFEERDVSALQRLAEMVETAVNHAVAAQHRPEFAGHSIEESKPRAEQVSQQISRPAKTPAVLTASAPPIASTLPVNPVPVVAPKQEQSAPTQTKPLFWSAAVRAQSPVAAEESRGMIAVPAVLRNLHQCQACGFPVSQGRNFCVECEDKQWRGQPSSATATVVKLASAVEVPRAEVPAADAEERTSKKVEATAVTGSPEISPRVQPSDAASTAAPAGAETMFLSNVLPTESWFASNKYVLAALVIVAVVIGAIAWFR